MILTLQKIGSNPPKTMDVEVKDPEQTWVDVYGNDLQDKIVSFKGIGRLRNDGYDVAPLRELGAHIVCKVK